MTVQAEKIHAIAQTGYKGALPRLLLAATPKDLNYEANADGCMLPALVVAAGNGHLDIILLLLQSGKVDINQQSSDNKWTALMRASNAGHTAVVALLLQHGANVTIKDMCRKTAILHAMLKNHNDVVELFLKHGNGINQYDTGGVTVLVWASREGHTAIVELVLQHGADVNAKKKDGWTALMAAASHGHREVVELLIKHNADINFQDKNGWTALMKASRSGHTAVVELLLKHGADVNVQNKDGRTALSLTRTPEIRKLLRDYVALSISIHQAAVAGDNAALSRLLPDATAAHLSYEAQVDGRPMHALAATTYKGHLEIVQMLLQAGKVSVDQTDKKSGNTALMHAARQGHVEVLKALVEAGADLTRQNKEGEIALDMTQSETVRAVLKSFDKQQCPSIQDKNTHKESPCEDNTTTAHDDMGMRCDGLLQQATQLLQYTPIMQRLSAARLEYTDAVTRTAEGVCWKEVLSKYKAMQSVEEEWAQMPLSESDYTSLPERHTALITEVTEACKQLRLQDLADELILLGNKLNELRKLDRTTMLPINDFVTKVQHAFTAPVPRETLELIQNKCKDLTKQVTATITHCELKQRLQQLSVEMQTVEQEDVVDYVRLGSLMKHQKDIKTECAQLGLADDVCSTVLQCHSVLVLEVNDICKTLVQARQLQELELVATQLTELQGLVEHMQHLQVRATKQSSRKM